MVCWQQFRDTGTSFIDKKAVNQSVICLKEATATTTSITTTMEHFMLIDK